MARIDQIMSFCKVVELKSFSLAAEAMLVSQPTISMQIKSLEEELGSELLHREGQKIVLTEDGEKVFPEFLKIISSFEKARQSISFTNSDIRGTLLIGASSGPAESLLPVILGDFKEKNRGAKVRMIVGDSSEIIDKVSSEAIEMGFVGTKRRDSRLAFKFFANDPLVLTCRPDHSAAKNREIDFNMLRRIPLILQQAGSGATINLLAGYGATIISKAGVERELSSGDLVEIKVRHLDLSREIYICVNKDIPLSNLADRFLKFSKSLNK